MKFSESLERASTRRTGPAVHRWTDEEFRAQRDDDLRIESISTRQVLVAVGLCLGIAALLTSGNLVSAAERRDYGSSRDAMLAIAEPIDRVANFLSLNRPGDLVHRIRFGDPEPLVDPLAITTPGEGVSSAGPEPTVAPVTEVEEPAAEAPATVPTTVVPEPYRTVTEQAPLNVFVAGDSQAEFPGQALTNRSVTGKLPFTVDVDSRIATGLARPDYFNWPAQLATIDDEVEAVVLFFGGNDYQDMELDGQRLVRGSDEWFEEYRRRIEVTLDLLQSPNRQVLWVAPPPIRDGETSAALGRLNQDVRDAAAGRPWVRVVPVDAIFAPNGTFAAYVTDSSGSDVRVRSGDGVHFTPKGASWVADLLVAEIRRYWDVTS